MGDLGLNENLDIYIDKTGDYAFVTGGAAFEQAIIIALIDFYEDLVGENDPDTMLEGVRVGARRAVDSVDLLDRVAQLDARFDEEKPNTVIVDIIFDTGEQLEFTVDDSGDQLSADTVRVFEDGTFESTTSFDVYEDGVLQ